MKRIRIKLTQLDSVYTYEYTQNNISSSIMYTVKTNANKHNLQNTVASYKHDWVDWLIVEGMALWNIT